MFINYTSNNKSSWIEYLIAIVIILFLYGLYKILKLLIRKPSSETSRQTSAFSHQSKSKVYSENKSDNFKQKGDDFEKFIAKKFDKRYFKILDWRGDKFSEGVYPISNKYPDLKIKFTMSNLSSTFAVECKFRSNKYNDVLIAEQHKINNYKRYSFDEDIPVFIVLGLKGAPSAPAECYIIPLKNVTSGTISYSDLQKFRRYNIDKDFYFDIKTLHLK